MSVPDIKELEKLVKFAAKWGINHIKLGDLELSWASAPQTPKRRRRSKSLTVGDILNNDNELIETDALTAEQLLDWSVRDPNEEAKA